MTSILLVDLSSIAHPIWHMSASEPDPDHASTAIIARVRALGSDQPHAAICCDSGRSFRRDISPEYKAQRPETDATLQHQIALAVDVLQSDGFPIWAAKGFEADDLIATATSYALAAPDLSVQIASADKDLLQLIEPRVSIKSLKDGSTVDADVVMAKFGVRPEQIRDYLSLVGDTSDNVKGAPGIGPKKAAALLAKYGTLEDLYADLDAHPSAFTSGLIVSLRDFQPRLAITRELITLRTDAPLAFEELFQPRVPADTAIFGEDTMREATLAEGIAQDVEETMQALPPTAPRRAEPPPTTSREETMKTFVTSAPIAAANMVVTSAPITPTQAAALPTVGAWPVPPAPDVLAPAPLEWERQLEPRSMAQAKQIAADLFASRMFSAYGNAPAVLSTIMAGRELGFQTMASLRAFHILEGKPALSAGAIHSLILTSGKAKYFRCAERTPDRATFETQRGDDPPMSLTFTLAEGRQAWKSDEKAWNASGWGRNPADMLVARALTKLARLVYPDICHGLYAPEELT